MLRRAAKETGDRRDAMQEFADSIVALLEQGVKPWAGDVDPGKCGGPQSPFNPVTKHRYGGVNVLILGMNPKAFTTGDSRWATYLQAQERGWQVRKGERSTMIFFERAGWRD